MATTATSRPEATGPTAAPAAPRVSPFALPSSTTSQFLLLVTLVGTVAAFAYDQIAGGASFWADSLRACVVTGDRQSASLPPVEVTRGYIGCLEGVLLRRGAAGLAGVGLVAALVVLGVLAHPRLLVRREGLVRFEPAEFPAVAAEIERCLVESRLDRRPEFYYEAFRRDRGGRAFGTGRRPRVRLALDLLADSGPGRAGPDVATLRAVVRHELAHVRNRDLTLTAMVVVVPYVFLAAVGLPLTVTLVVRSPSEVWTYAWRLAALLGLLLLIRASVFRTREHYADVRASVTGPPDESRFLAAAFPDVPPGRVRRLGRNVRARLGLLPHPHPAARAEVVDRPARLLGAGLVEGAATGVTAGVAYYFLRNLVVTVVAGNPVLAGAVAGMAVGALVATVTGQSMWRAALAAGVEGRAVPSGVRAALGLALGLVAAEFLTPPVLTSWHLLAGARLPVALVALAALGAGCLVFTRWCATAATTWLGASRARTLGTPVRAGLAVGAVTFGAPYAGWSLAVATGVGSTSPLAGVTALLVNPGLALAVVLGAAFPLLAAVPARRPAPARPVLLDAPHRLVLPMPGVRPALVLVPAVLVAATYLLVDVAVLRGQGVFRILAAFRAPIGATEAVQNLQLQALVGFFLAAEVLVVAGVAVALARRPVLGTWTHLLAAAVVTGQLVGLAFPAYPLITACDAQTCGPRFLVLALGVVVLASTLVATTVAVPAWLVLAGVGALRRAATGAGPGPPPPMRPVRPGRLRRVRSTAGVGLAAVVGLSYVAGVTLALLYVFGALAPGRTSVADDVRLDVADRSPTTVAVACGAFNARNQQLTVLSTDYLRQLRIARALGAVTDSGVLRSAGAAKEEAVLSGDARASTYVDRALVPLCSGTAPTPAPPPR